MLGKLLLFSEKFSGSPIILWWVIPFLLCDIYTHYFEKFFQRLLYFEVDRVCWWHFCLGTSTIRSFSFAVSFNSIDPLSFSLPFNKSVTVPFLFLMYFYKTPWSVNSISVYRKLFSVFLSLCSIWSSCSTQSLSFLYLCLLCSQNLLWSFSFELWNHLP